MGSADVIVIGLGIIGSSACLHLARRGLKVVGLDSYAPRHKNGASHGQTRIIRKAYFEAPDYVPLLHRAYELWYQLEREFGQALIIRNGGLFIGRPESEAVSGSLQSARLHGLEHEYLTAAEIAARFPAWRVPSHLVAVYEAGAGTMLADRCWQAQLTLAEKSGANLRFDERVHSWKAGAAEVQVVTARSEYRAKQVVICPGPWAAELLPGLSVPFRVIRMANAFFAPETSPRFAPENFPVFCLDLGDSFYYGFPNLGGMKIGRHDRGEQCTPETARRTVDQSEVDELRSILDEYAPGAAGRLTDTLTCLYTLTPDRHFVIDRHPAHANVTIAAGFSGHGFKFASVAGEIVSDLVERGSTEHPIEFLSATRTT